MKVPASLRKAIALLDESDIAVARRQPGTGREIHQAERTLRFRFPASYRAYLRLVGPIRIPFEENGSARWLVVYGIHKKQSLPNVVWANTLGPAGQPRPHLGVAHLKDPTFGGYRDEFALDVDSLARSREASVVVSVAPKFKYDTGPIAPDFGTWIVTMLEGILPKAMAMWSRRIAQEVHIARTDEYGQPGPHVFYSECTCGWTAPLRHSRQRAEQEAGEHMQHPERMRTIGD